MDYYPWQLKRKEVEQEIDEQVIRHEAEDGGMKSTIAEEMDTSRKVFWSSDLAKFLHGGMTWHSKANNRKNCVFLPEVWTFLWLGMPRAKCRQR